MGRSSGALLEPEFWSIILTWEIRNMLICHHNNVFMSHLFPLLAVALTNLGGSRLGRIWGRIAGTDRGSEMMAGASFQEAVPAGVCSTPATVLFSEV